MALTPRWTPLDPHPLQLAWRGSRARFNVVPAGRRSGKTERAKRKLALRAIKGVPDAPYPTAFFFAGAPVWKQAKRIYWDDLKALTRPLWNRKPSETELVIYLPLSEIHVLGLDVPSRIEGTPWDGGVLDEYGNMRPEVWPQHVRPALSDRMGWCDFIGVPEGRNHYYALHSFAKREEQRLGPEADWRAFTWPSADILDPAEIVAARHELDELTFQQEYEASFVSFHGQAYYRFRRETHAFRSLTYDPDAELVFALDFNVSPGTAAVIQEQRLPNGPDGTGVIGEVWIPRNSNTPAVCRKLLEDWGEHVGPVTVYGDATGGARGTAQVEGSDWDIVRSMLGGHFGDRFRLNVRSSNPPERVRVNAMNTRIENAAGERRLMVDPVGAPHVVEDLEGTRLLEGGAGEIDKRSDPMLTHLTDAIGYYVEMEFPLRTKQVEEFEFLV